MDKICSYNTYWEGFCFGGGGQFDRRRNFYDVGSGFWVQGSGFWVQPSRWPKKFTRLRRAASLIEHETEVACEGKLQITSSKLQINLKSQYPIPETHFHFPGRKGNFDLGSMMK
jgi:hypothetical protein